MVFDQLGTSIWFKTVLTCNTQVNYILKPAKSTPRNRANNVSLYFINPSPKPPLISGSDHLLSSLRGIVPGLSLRALHEGSTAYCICSGRGSKRDHLVVVVVAIYSSSSSSGTVLVFVVVVVVTRY